MSLILKTLAQDNHGQTYQVSLRQDHKYDHRSLVLHIDSTPSGWYLSDLLDQYKSREFLWIDMGQDWRCTNIDQILDEVRAMFGGSK